jgi:hypothetical protein
MSNCRNKDDKKISGKDGEKNLKWLEKGKQNKRNNVRRKENK